MANNDNDQKINLNRIWTTRSQDGKESIILGIFGRKPSLTVFSTGNDSHSRKPLIKLDVPADRAMFMCDVLSKVLKSESPVRMSVVTSSYNFAAKKRVPGPSIVFFKDEKRRIGFDLIAEGSSIKFYFDANRDTCDGQESLTEEVRSVYGARLFSEVVLKQQLPLAILLACMNPMPSFGERSRGGASEKPAYSEDSTDVWG